MQTALTLQLLDCSIAMNELTIGQAMDIAKIPFEFNERRISAMIAHVTDDLELAGKLTVQERYHFLINHQSLTENQYSDSSNAAQFAIKNITGNPPKVLTRGDARDGTALAIGHLYGAHVCVLEAICENVADWLMGQIACQLSGDIGFFIGGDEIIQWQPLLPTMSEVELNQAIQERVALLNNLTITQFNELADIYYDEIWRLRHFVEISFDNSGVTVYPSLDDESKGGAGDVMPARFCALDGLQGVSRRLSECVTS